MTMEDNGEHFVLENAEGNVNLSFYQKTYSEEAIDQKCSSYSLCPANQFSRNMFISANCK